MENSLEIYPEERDKILYVGNDNNDELYLQSKEDISMIGKSKVYINSQGEIIIESTTSITLRAPKIIIEGEMQNNNITGFSKVASKLKNTLRNGIVRQQYSDIVTL